MEKYDIDRREFLIFTVAITQEEFKGIRVTPNVYTSLGELDRFCDAMETIARKGIK